MKVSFKVEGLKQMRKRHDAVAKTLDPGGRGEVACSRRKKLPFERANKRKGRKGQRTASGWAIANFQRSLGRDYFDYPDKELGDATRWMNSKIEKAIGAAARTGNSRARDVRDALSGTARILAQVAVKQATDGKLRPNAPKYRRKKKALQENGLGVRRYGLPAPPGILTGRTIDGFRGRFRKGFTPGKRGR